VTTTDLEQWQADLEHAAGDGAHKIATDATKRAQLEATTGYRGPHLPGPALTAVLNKAAAENTRSGASQEDSGFAAGKVYGLGQQRRGDESHNTVGVSPAAVGTVADNMAAEMGDKGAKLLVGKT
jgi:hypothetical protein